MNRGNHSSRPPIARRLKRPTRGLSCHRNIPCRDVLQITGRVSPPLLFGLAPRGVCHAIPIARDAVGSYPTFSPLPSAAILEDLPKVFSPADHRSCGHRRFVFCGTFRSPTVTCYENPSREPRTKPTSQPPGVTRRATLRSPDFPPGVPLLRRPAIARPARSGHCTAYRLGHPVDNDSPPRMENRAAKKGPRAPDAAGAPWATAENIPGGPAAVAQGARSLFDRASEDSLEIDRVRNTKAVSCAKLPRRQERIYASSASDA